MGVFWQVGCVVPQVCVLVAPNWPTLLSPQHCASPEAINAHVCRPPELKAVTQLKSVGQPLEVQTFLHDFLSVVVLSPICPKKFLPQHLTLPEVSKAHVCSKAVSDVSPVMLPAT